MYLFEKSLARGKTCSSQEDNHKGRYQRKIKGNSDDKLNILLVFNTHTCIHTYLHI